MEGKREWMPILVKWEARLQDVADQLYEKGVQEAEIYLHKRLCEGEIYTERRNWFTDAILNMMGKIPVTQIKVWDEESLQTIENAIENAKVVWGRNIEKIGQE